MDKKVLNSKTSKQSFVARLQQLVKVWQQYAKPALSHRKSLIKLMASGYFDEKYSRYHVLNLIDRGVSTIVPFLVEGNPRVLVETDVLEYKPWAYTTTLAINYLLTKMNFAETVLIPAAVNSMFGAAITRTDYYYDRIISLEDEVIKRGTPRVELIDDSNYVGDPSARCRTNFVFEGDIYTLPTEYAKDFFGKGKVNPDWITSDSKLLTDFSPHEIDHPDFDRKMFALRDYSTFIDLYLRDDNTIITIMPEGKTDKILRTREWDGPGDGPYDYLGYQYLPESPLPIPPAWKWHDMDVTANLVVDKLRELVENQKDLIGYSAESEEDIKKAIKAPNIGAVKIDSPDAFKMISLNGIKDRSNWDYISFILTEQTKQGANPDVLGGRGAQAPTLGQEQLVYNNATRIIGNMYNRFHGFMTSIVKKLAWTYWTDPTLEVPVVKNVPGYGPLPEVFAQPDKVADFYDFVFKVVPYSTQRTSPEIQYQKIMQLMSQWVLPTLQIAEAQGAQLSIPEATKLLADYSGITNFNTFYKTIVPKPGESVPYQMQPFTRRSEGKPNMGSDAFGTTQGNQNSNLNMQQERTSDEKVI
jgi:hypothetical protein